MSASGVAVLADVQPQIGMPLAVGACVGRVIRLLPGGFAVRFVEPQRRSQLDRLLGRAVSALRRQPRCPTSTDADAARAEA